jgi:prepilin-type processing-associated H-X9-DG protein
MSNIKLNELTDTTPVSEQEAAQVKGGPIYMQYEGIKGNVSAQSKHVGGVNVALGDGSVRF